MPRLCIASLSCEELSPENSSSIVSSKGSRGRRSRRFFGAFWTGSRGVDLAASGRGDAGGGFTRSLSALVHFTLHTGAGVDSVVYIVHVEYMDYVYGASRVLTVFIL
mgnify:CR=1 FL=1